MNEKIFILTNRKRNTSHLLHLVLTVFTGGLWLIVWGITMRVNSNHNKQLDREIDQLMAYKSQGLSDADTYHRVKLDQANAEVTQGRVIFVLIVVVCLYFYFR